MNVVIQNGCEHVISRKEIKPITLYQSKNLVSVEFYKKKFMLGLFCPKNNHDKTMKHNVIQELLIGLSHINDNNDLPKKLSASLRNKYIAETEVTKNKCLKVID